MTELLTVWSEISEAFDQVTEADIRRVQRGLHPVRTNENPLGVLHNEALKKLWALAHRFDALSKQAVLDAEHKAETDDQAKELRQQALRYDALEEVARDLFWAQAKDDLGVWDHSRAGSIGIREDWMLVCGPPPTKGIEAILGGIIGRQE